ncbi:MAG: hypothetical protein E2O65_07915 [Gammaproteobacteria bacterium]|nr:MAG: hypothetical protein E2O65_07915 [Gammaproteobacteria bacterium]
MKPQGEDDLRPEYSEDLIRSGIRGKYAKRYRSQSNVIVVDDDLTDVFPNAKAVNAALRDYLELRKKAAT